MDILIGIIALGVYLLVGIGSLKLHWTDRESEKPQQTTVLIVLTLWPFFYMIPVLEDILRMLLAILTAAIAGFNVLLIAFNTRLIRRKQKNDE